MVKKEQVDKVLDLLKRHGRTSDYEHFFDSLNKVEWVPYLLEAGYFKEPPEPQYTSEGYRLPYWPESAFLARVASQNPILICEVIAQVPETENGAVYDDLATACINMPVENAASLSQKFDCWLEAKSFFRIVDKLGNILVNLSRAGLKQPAIETAKALLRLKPQKKHNAEIYRAAPRCNSYDFGKMLKASMPSFVESFNLDALQVLKEAMINALTVETRSGNNFLDRKDSWHWRRAIEDHFQNSFRDEPLHIMLACLRDMSLKLIKEKPSQVRQVISLLQNTGVSIFDRLSIYLIKEAASVVPDLAADYILNSINMTNLDTWHEYSHLLKSHFRFLSEEQKKKFSELLNDINKNDSHENKNRWQHRLLSMIDDEHLTADLRQQKQHLLQQYNQLDHPDFLSYISSGWVGPESPLSENELSAMTTPELIKMLKEWKSTKDDFWGGPSKSGLGRELQKIASKSPARFLSEAKQFIGLEHTYVRALFLGLSEGIKQLDTVDWEATLDLMDWAVNQGGTPYDDSDTGRDEDPHWGWTRQTIARIIDFGFKNETATEFRQEDRQRVWKIIEVVCGDSDPNSDREHSNLKNREYYQMAINSVRGEGLSTAIEYGLWIKRSLKIGENENAFDMKIPELGKLLERHLDSKIEKSMAVRSIFGRYFPWILALDKAWTKNHIASIFPSFTDELFWAAWDTYVQFCPPYDDVFKILEKHYMTACEALKEPNSNEKKFRSPQERLGEHLVILYFRRHLDLSSDLLIKFYENASPEIRSRTTSFVGRAFYEDNEKINVNQSQAKRFMEYWDWRFRECVKDTQVNRKELEDFGWWLVSDTYPKDWSIPQAAEVMKHTQSLDADHRAFEYLNNNFEINPGKVLECFEHVAKGPFLSKGLYHWEEPMMGVLQKAHAIPKLRERAGHIANVLIAKGFRSFRKVFGD